MGGMGWGSSRVLSLELGIALRWGVEGTRVVSSGVLSLDFCSCSGSVGDGHVFHRWSPNNVVVVSAELGSVSMGFLLANTSLQPVSFCLSVILSRMNSAVDHFLKD